MPRQRLPRLRRITVTFREFRGLHMASVLKSSCIYVSGLNPRFLWVVKRELYSCQPNNVFKSKVLVQFHDHPPDRPHMTIDRVSHGTHVRGCITEFANSIEELHKKVAVTLVKIALSEV